jgi:hypothetical protein
VQREPAQLVIKVAALLAHHAPLRRVRRLIPLGFLSPKVVQAIVEGRQPPDLTVIALTRRIDLPLLWSAQEQALGLR